MKVYESPLRRSSRALDLLEFRFLDLDAEDAACVCDLLRIHGKLGVES